MMPPSPALSPEAKYRLLLKLSQEIGHTLDLREVLNYLLDTLRTTVPYDAAGVFVLNRRVPLGQDTGERVIAGMATIGFDDTPRDEDPMLLQGKGIIGHVIASGQPVVAPDVSRDPHYVEGRLATRSEIAVPIVVRGEVIGALNLENDAVDSFSEADLDFLEFFAVAAAISIEKAIVHREVVELHRIEQQLRIAREVQAALLPAADPAVPGLDVAGMNVPTWEIGGDYYDYLRRPDGGFWLAVADVSGKGVPAALIMATFRAALRSLVHRESDLTLIARALNRILRDSMDASRFVTAIFGEFDGKTGSFRYINCGHNPPVLLRADGRVEMLAGGGPALGMWDGSRFEPGRVALAVGDTLAVYTDGVVEVLDAGDHQFGTERLARALRGAIRGPARDMVTAVADATRAFAGRPGYDDDFTLVVVRRVSDSRGAAG